MENDADLNTFWLDRPKTVAGQSQGLSETTTVLDRFTVHFLRAFIVKMMSETVLNDKIIPEKRQSHCIVPLHSQSIIDDN